MADSYTPVLNLTLVEVGASRDTWGTKLNDNATILDQFVSQAMPIGAILDFAGSSAPSGWLICDGRTISRTTYSNLFAVIGTAWGAGDGSTTFSLPPTPGRVLVGPGVCTDTNGLSLSFTYATFTGAFSNPILQTHLPNYAMSTDTQGLHSHGGATVNAGYHSHTLDAQGAHSHGGATQYGNVDHTHTVPRGGTAIEIGYVAGGGYPTFIGPLVNAGDVGSGPMSQNHLHAITVDGVHVHNVAAAGDHTHTINSDGSHAHTVMLGGGGNFFEFIQPLLVVTKIIYAGTQATTATSATLASSSQSVASDERAELAIIREELAALRAILAPPRSRQVPRTPMRGTH